jgi:putative peptide zinc metalloprotease protein
MQTHHTTFELSSCKLRLREDLSFHLQEYQGAKCYLVEDEVNSKYYRVGLPEYQLISLLDGSTTMGQAIAETAAKMGDQALTEQEAVSICKWLVDSGLASTAASRTSGRLHESFEELNRRKQMAKLNPVTPKFSLFNPDPFLEVLNKYFGWLFSAPLFAVWLAVVLFASYQVYSNWDQLWSSHVTVFSPGNWIWLGLTWLVLKVFHEIAHGVACKRFSGDVRQAGIVLIVMIPLPFVDVTSSWRFPSKWHRIFVAAAGMYVEIFLAALAAIVWCWCDIGVTKTQAYNVMLAGSLTTVLFNANPLMRFDGYYMLTDWLEMPNLGTHGQQWSKWLGRKYYLGLDAKKPSWPEGRGFIVGAYAVLALIWRVVICVGLALAAESLFFGAGIVLATIAIALWVIWPICKLLKMVFVGEKTEEQPSKIRFGLLTTGLTAAAYVFLVYVPWHAQITAPAIVDFHEKVEVRSVVSGFVKEVLVRPDDEVVAGQLLARLENQELSLELQKLEYQIASSEVRSSQLREQEEMAAFDAELGNLYALKEQYQERLEQRDALSIVATDSGLVLADDLESLVGVFLSAGDKLLTIGSKGPKEVLALIDQRDLELFRDHESADVNVHIWGEGVGSFQAKLERVVPRAKTQLPHPAFSSTNGGPLPVRYANPNEQQQDSDTALELVKPRFLANIQLAKHDGTRLRSGQAAQVSFRATRGSVWDVLSETVVDWFRAQRAMVQQASF